MPTYELPPFIGPNLPWPPPHERERLERIRDDRELFECDHSRVFAEHYKRLRRDAPSTEGRDPTTIRELLAKLATENQQTYEQEINLPHALSLLWADLIASEPPRFMPAAQAGQEEREAIRRLTEGLDLEIHEAAIEQSVAGNVVFVVSLEGGRARIQSYPADQWIPWVRGKQILAHVLWSVEPLEGDERRQAINFEIHYPGHVKYRRFEYLKDQLGAELPPRLPEGVESPDQDLPGVTEPLVHVASNIATSKSPYGLSDYRAIETLIPQLNVQSSQWGMIFDKHAAPTMYGPESVLEWDEATGRYVYRTAPDGKFIPIAPGEEKPGYLVWDAQMQANFQAWDRLMEIFYTVTGTTPAAFSNHKEGGAASGTALRLRMARPLEVAQRKRNRIDYALRRALLVAQQLEVYIGGQQYQPTPVIVQWRDGLPADPKEAAEIEESRKRAGNTTTKHSIMRLDGLPEEEAAQIAAEIAAERAMEEAGVWIPGAAQGLNGPAEPTESEAQTGADSGGQGDG